MKSIFPIVNDALRYSSRLLNCRTLDARMKNRIKLNGAIHSMTSAAYEDYIRLRRMMEDKISKEQEKQMITEWDGRKFFNCPACGRDTEMSVFTVWDGSRYYCSNKCKKGGKAK